MSNLPEPPTPWSGQLLAVYPDGSQTDLSTNGVVLRPGDVVGRHVLKRFEVHPEPMLDGSGVVW